MKEVKRGRGRPRLNPERAQTKADKNRLYKERLTATVNKVLAETRASREALERLADQADATQDIDEARRIARAAAQTAAVMTEGLERAWTARNKLAGRAPGQE